MYFYYYKIIIRLSLRARIMYVHTYHDSNPPTTAESDRKLEFSVGF